MTRAVDPGEGASQRAPTFRIQGGQAIPHPSGLARTRWRALGLLLVLSLVGLAVLLWLQDVLAGLYLAAPGEAGCTPVDRDRVLGISAAAIVLPALWAGLWLLQLARRVSRASQWPYPGIRLLRPVRVRRGIHARAFARVVALLGSLLILGGSAIGVSLYWVVDHLLADTLILCQEPG
jgi:hypothetical protein